jgi:tRNA G10  N-methylase Trm11
MFWFVLWREFKLSIAEILAVFNNAQVIYSWKSVLLLDWLKKEEILEKMNSLGWTIKVFEVNLKVDKNSVFESIFLEAKNRDWKFNYWFNIFPEKKEKLNKFLIEIKRFLQKKWVSSRFVNKADKNLSSAQILWNSLLKKGADFNLLDLDWIYYFWKTIWVQDIDAYSARDYSKSRDMQVWMLPPKLAQIMINLANSPQETKTIYDPFVWLGTILIEAKLMWFEKIFWSDLSEKMVETARNNTWWKIEKLNAKFVNEVSFWDEVKNWIIVTEGYLWEIMTQKNISLDRIKKQRESLKKIYEWFFSSLKKWWFSWNIVITFPFWDLKWKYIFFDEVYQILDKYCTILPFFSSEFNFNETKTWSLLYKRSKQLVWREIFKLKIKD